MVRIYFLILFFFICSITADIGHTQPLTIEQDKIKIGIEETNGEYKITVTSNTPVSAVIDSLSNPPRIVLDLERAKVRIGRVVHLADHPLIRSVRIGIHPQKVRCVFDLKQDLIPKFTRENTDKSVILRIPSEKHPVFSEPTPGATSSVPDILHIQPTITPTPSPTATLSQIEPTATPTQVSRFVTPDIRPTEKVAPRLNKLIFDYSSIDRTPILRIVFNSDFQFRIVKTDPTKVKLYIPNVLLDGEHLKLPFFAPQDFLGLTMVRASSEKNGIKVELYLEEGSRINAYREANELNVRVFSPALPVKPNQ